MVIFEKYQFPFPNFIKVENPKSNLITTQPSKKCERISAFASPTNNFYVKLRALPLAVLFCFVYSGMYYDTYVRHRARTHQVAFGNRNKNWDSSNSIS